MRKKRTEEEKIYLKYVRTVCAGAKKKGQIKKSPCEVCGRVKRVDGHHVSYLLKDAAKLMWLCKKHHFRWHRKNEAIMPSKAFISNFLKEKADRMERLPGEILVMNQKEEKERERVFRAYLDLDSYSKVAKSLKISKCTVGTRMRRYKKDHPEKLHLLSWSF